MDVIVRINHDIGVAFVPDDGRQKGVIEQRDDGAGANVRLNHGVVDLGLVEKSAKFVIVVLPHDVNVVLAVDVEGGPISVLRAARDNGIIDGRNGPVIRSHAVHWSGPWRESGVHDGVLAGLIGPDHVNAVVLVNNEIGMPNLVKSRIGDLGGID